MSALAARLGFFAGLARGLLRRDGVSYAVFFLTDLCNATCPYCFNTRLGHFATGHEPADKGRLLTVEEYGRLADGLRPLFQAVFGGGEPFLREDIDAIAEVFYRRGGARLISIPTNGSLVDRASRKAESMLARCPGATFNLQVSLDALGPNHDRMRGLPDGFGKATELLHRYLRLRDRTGRVNVVVNTAVTEENLDDVRPLQDWLAVEFGADGPYHNVQFDQRLGALIHRRPDLAARAAEIDRAGAARPGRRSFWRRAVDRYYLRFIDALILRQIAEDRMIYACNAGRKLVVVMPDGELSPCEPFVFDARYKRFRKFNVRDFGYDVGRIRREPAYREALAFIGRKGCAACPWSCAAVTSMTYEPRNWPLFWRVPPLERTPGTG